MRGGKAGWESCGHDREVSGMRLYVGAHLRRKYPGKKIGNEDGDDELW